MDNQKINKLTKENVNSLFDSMVTRFFILLGERKTSQCRHLLEEIKNLDFSKNRQTLLKQKIFFILIDKILKEEQITYSEIARILNEEYKINVPERGNSMGRMIGNVLGSLSIMSKIGCGILISVYVVNKSNGRPGKGLRNLVLLMNQGAKKVDLKMERAKVDIVFASLREEKNREGE